MLRIGLLLAATSAGAAHPSLSAADLQRCLGVPAIAARTDLIAVERARSSAEVWTAACRQARDAEARRKGLLASLFVPEAKPPPGYESAFHFAQLAAAATDRDVAELFRRAAYDRVARSSLAPQAKSQFADGVSPLADQLLTGLISMEVVKVDADNRTWLEATVARRGWFTGRRDGPEADLAALLLVQHGDQDRAYQKRMIDRLEPLMASGDTSPVHFPSLYDRWAEGAGQPQRYGLAGRCVAAGRWEPLPIADEVAVDERRAAAGLRETLAKEIARHSTQCR